MTSVHVNWYMHIVIESVYALSGFAGLNGVALHFVWFFVSSRYASTKK